MAMKTHHLFVSSILAVLASCSLFKSKSIEVVGPDLAGPALRESSAGLGSYHASAKALYPTVAPELATQTCFELSIDVIGQIDEALFEHWPCVVIDQNGENYDVVWSEESLKKTPTYSIVGSYHGGQKKFQNQGKACTSKTITWKQNLELSCQPKLMPILVSSSIHFFWAYHDPSSPTAPASGTPSSYQRYRGY